MVRVQAPPVAPPPELPPEKCEPAEPLEGQPRLRHRGLLLHDERLPPWLVSLITHAILVLLLALISLRQPEPPAAVVQLDISRGDRQSQRDPLARLLASKTPSQSSLRQVKPLRSVRESESQMLVVARGELLATEHSFVPVPSSTPLAKADTSHPEVRIDSTGGRFYLPSGGGLEGRSPARRSQLADEYGASPESEAAVEGALQWLVTHQNNDGSWDFDLSHGPCSGKCHNPRNNPDDQATPKTAATGLALLPFLGAGYTHLEGQHAKCISRGLYYLRGRMRETSNGRELMHGSMYGHAIATLAMAEAYAMTRDEELFESLRDLVMFTTVAQHSAGGWRYKPGQPGDMTVTGWQVLALKSCQLGNVPIPTDVMPRAHAFVKSLADRDGPGYGYLERDTQPTPSAVGILLSMYLGTPASDRRVVKGCDYLLQLGPSRTNVYFNYYATMALHHARHKGFATWNAELRDAMVRTQARDGHEKGSWHFPDRFGSTGGRLYTTAMCALVLETYYRYLPLWQAAEFPL